MPSLACWLNAILVLGNFQAASHFFSKIHIWSLIQEITPNQNLHVSSNSLAHIQDTWSTLC